MSIIVYLDPTDVPCRPDADNQLRTAAYEVLNAFVTNSANDSLTIVGHLTNVILERLESTIPMSQQVVSVDDKLMLEEMQTSLTSVVIAIIQRLETEIKPQADRIMQLMLQLLNASAVEEDFAKYMEAFAPFLYTALANQEEPAICAMAIGLVSDISRALNEKIQPYCDALMNNLLNDLRVSLANHPEFHYISDEF
jgi:importin subunit beta-1